MKRFILPEENPGATVRLDGDDYNYLINVRRMKKGSLFAAATRKGRLFQAEISQVRQGNCTVALSETKPDTAGKNNSVEIILIQALPKGKKMDTVIRQATECGVTAIQPVISSHTVAVPSPEDYRKKQERWEKIAREAVQQSGGFQVPRVLPLIPLTEIASIDDKNSIGLLFHQIPLEKQSLHGYLFSDKKRVYICIGPEGGYSDPELGDMKLKGYMPVYLGEQVLRAETAVVYTLGAIQTIIRERLSWKPTDQVQLNE